MKSNMLRLALLGIGVFLTGVSAHQAMGAPTVFFARDDSTGLMPNSLAKFNHFTTALGSFGVENVETISGMNPTLVFGTTGITASTQGVMTQAALVFAIDDYALLETDSFVGPANTTFTQKMGRAKLQVGSDPFSIFEAFEVLSIGIQGKQALWKALDAVASEQESLRTLDFSALASRALEQYERVERRRIAYASSLLADEKTEAV